ncbi:MAG: tripartite tricarboxylate transporter substrate binding protein [Rhizobiales bacterium]|nr:tripartite tricarboxylate transporter substrate binding protein [Hyphomicrobiales bacterium]
MTLTLVLGAAAANAQDYPTRRITVIVPFAGGSASDVVSRIMLDRMSKSMGQPIVVENRPGAGGNIGTAAAAKADPDGYTLVGSGSGPIAANTVLYANLGYDPQTDFEIISPFAVFPIVIVASAKLPVKTLPELIAYAKASPNPLGYGSVGIGSSQHLSGAYFEQVAGVKLSHVPYRNIAQYGPDLMAGTVPLGFQWLPNVLGPINAGGAKPIAVASGTRLAALPDTPTTAEAGLPTYQASGWFAMLAPKGTPKAIVAKLNQELAKAIAEPAVRERFAQQGAQPMAVSPEDAAKFVSAEIVKWREVITKGGIPIIR